MRRSFGLAASAVLALAMTGCADQGAHVASSSGASASGASASGASASGMSASHASASTAAMSSSSVPAGVAAQYSVLEEEIAANGGATTTGPWRIGYIVEAAEPWYEPPRNGKMSWRTPKPGETHHIEIIPIEKSTGRIMPETPISVQVLDQNGKVVDEKSLNFYYTDFFHYANNFEVPKPGTYTLKATIGVPTFYRHADPGEPPALAQGATVTFDGVRLTPSG
jgi:hypothetical protein